MKPISQEVLDGLKERGISLEEYTEDSVVKALLDADFDHDYILKSIDEGDITSLKKKEKKEGPEEKGDEKDPEEKGDEKDPEEKDTESGERTYKAMFDEFSKGQNALFKSLGEQLASVSSEISSLRAEISQLKDQRSPFKGINPRAFIEKSFGQAGESGEKTGDSTLSKSMNAEQIKRVLTTAFEQEKDDEIKKSLANDVMEYSLGRNLTKSAMDTLSKKGYSIVE